MRAAVITRPGGPEVLQIQEMPLPEPVGDQVRVRVLAAGLNRADLLQRAGGYPAPPGAPAAIPGLEFAGQVEALGKSARRFQVGERVFGIVGGGAHAEYLLTHEDLLAPVPASLDDISAAAVPDVFMTAHDALFNRARLQLGEQVLIHAAGSGVGTAAVQLAAAAGARVWGTARSEEKRKQALSLGLEAALAPDTFRDDIVAATGGTGVQVLIDFVGGPYLAANLETLAPLGRLVLVGLMGDATGTIDLGMVMRKRLQIIGTVLRSRSRTEKAELTARFADQVVPLLVSGKVRPILDRVFALDQIAEAHAYMASNANYGKIVLRIAG